METCFLITLNYAHEVKITTKIRRSECYIKNVQCRKSNNISLYINFRIKIITIKQIDLKFCLYFTQHSGHNNPLKIPAQPLNPKFTSPPGDTTKSTKLLYICRENTK